LFFKKKQNKKNSIFRLTNNILFAIHSGGAGKKNSYLSRFLPGGSQNSVYSGIPLPVSNTHQVYHETCNPCVMDVVYAPWRVFL
jgi:hypothetical protein